MAAATMYVTVSGAGDNSGDSWANAMSYSDWETDMETYAEAGDIYYVAGGTYTLTSDFSCQGNDANATNMIHVIGVNSGTTNEPPTASDHATGDSRPLIAAGGYAFLIGANWTVRNIRMTTTASNGFYGEGNSIRYNCKCYNSSGSSRPAFFFYNGYSSVFIGCEGQSDNGTAITSSGGGAGIFYCYAHDSVTGFSVGNGSHPMVGNIADTCTTGFNFSDKDCNAFISNTIYNCTTGISGTTSTNHTFLNNIIDGCTTGVSFTADYDSNIFEFNVWDNTTDCTNATKGINDITADPSMTDPANGDFSIGSGSNCSDAGIDAGEFTGATV